MIDIPPQPSGEPLQPLDGISPGRERLWGVIGGVVGATVGMGSAAIAVLVDGASWHESGLYPSIFRQRSFLVLDFYFLGLLLVGLGFSTAAAILSRKSPHPRTDAFGATLLGTILTGCAGLILFTRLVALITG